MRYMIGRVRQPGHANTRLGLRLSRFFHQRLKQFRFNWGGVLVAVSAVLILATCDKLPNPFQSKLPESTAFNRLPDTHLFLNFQPDTVDTLISELTDSNGTYLDTTITYIRHLPDTTTSRQVLYWWGDDSDGEVVGYYYKWNYQSDWTYTTSESDTFYLPLQVMFAEFSFEVKAVDNESGVDISPARLVLPIANQPPVIRFADGSNPPVGTNPNVEEVSFPTRTFVWSVSDLDGAETINHVRWALDDTTQWHYVPGNVTSVTLTDLSADYHTFFVQAIDTAGSMSQLITYPDSSDNTTANGWRVREPVGDFLLVDDYPRDATGPARTFYTTILDSLYGANSYTVIEVRDGVKAMPYAINDQVAMFSYFKTVIWYHVADAPSLPSADGGLRTFLDNGGNLFVSSIRVDPNYTFTSIDSAHVLNPTGRMSSGLQIYFVDPLATATSDTVKFTLKTSSLISRRVSSYSHSVLDYGATSKDLFILQESRGSGDNWTSNPAIAQLFQSSPSSGKSVFFSLPFHSCNGNSNIIPVMDYILNQVFE